MRNTILPAQLYLLAGLFFFLPFSAITAEEIQTNELPWYEQSFQDILSNKIITATRSEKNISHSPSSISVYTAEDIKVMGVRNVKELLERVPGFFVNRQYVGPAIGSRGYIGDNEQFLLLIDGHNVNSIVEKGPGYFFLFPMLEHIKRVEIIRGPGSTLWGSDAALGIIHLITKDGGDINGKQLSHSYSHADGYQYSNVQVGQQYYEDVDMMLSITNSRSKGFTVASDSGSAGGGFTGPTGRWEMIDSSWEIYAKARVKDYAVRMRLADVKNSNPANSFGKRRDEGAFHRRRHMYLDLENLVHYGSRLELESRFFASFMANWQALANPLITPAVDVVWERHHSRESSAGVEFIGRWQAAVSHHLMFGYRGVVSTVDPVYENILFPSPDTTTGTATLAVRPDKKDINQAVFIEDDWQLIEDTLGVVAGIRFDKNNLREDNTIILPRLAFNYQLNPFNNINLAYNTGYIRPPVGIGFLNQTPVRFEGGQLKNAYGVPKSEEIESLEFKYSFQGSSVAFNANLYRHHIKDSFFFVFQPDSTPGSNKILYYANLPTIKSYGYELSLKWQLHRDIAFESSFSHVLQSRIDRFTGSYKGINYDLRNTIFKFAENFLNSKGESSSYPQLMWNLGVTYRPDENTGVNLFYRGWDNMLARKLEGVGLLDYSYGPEHFVDFNYYRNNILLKNLNINVFVKNLLDNDDSEIHRLYYGGSWQALGRSIGAQITYKF